MPNSDVLVVFHRPSTWYGWAICMYQLMRGVKYWQVSHCEIYADEGVYAYRIDDVLHGRPEEPCYIDDKTILHYMVTHTTHGQRQSLSRMAHRLWGDFNPLSPLSGNHCVRYVKTVLQIRCKANLPGQLLMHLERVNNGRVQARNAE
jgi:hypothetical protein